MLDKAILLSCSYAVVKDTLAYCITALSTSNLVKCLKPTLDKVIIISCNCEVVTNAHAYCIMPSFTSTLV